MVSCLGLFEVVVIARWTSNRGGRQARFHSNNLVSMVKAVMFAAHHSRDRPFQRHALRVTVLTSSYLATSSWGNRLDIVLFSDIILGQPS